MVKVLKNVLYQIEWYDITAYRDETEGKGLSKVIDYGLCVDANYIDKSGIKCIILATSISDDSQDYTCIPVALITQIKLIKKVKTK